MMKGDVGMSRHEKGDQDKMSFLIPSLHLDSIQSRIIKRSFCAEMACLVSTNNRICVFQKETKV